MTRLLLTLLAALMGVATLLTACANESTTASIPDDFDYFGAVPWDLPNDAEERVVDKVHDGDSINLTEVDDDWWEKYRIVGIQAPEIEGYRTEECYGQQSAAFLQELLPRGTRVWVQQDISDKDTNDRYLRHIFIQDEETGDYYLLSEVLVLGGYARQRSYKPDDLYDDILIEAQHIADENDAGLWGECAAD